MSADRVSPELFLKELDAFLKNPEARITVPASMLMDVLNRAQLNEALTQHLGQKPKLTDHIGDVVGHMSGPSESRHPFDILPSSSTVALWKTLFGYSYRSSRYANDQGTLVRIINGFTLKRDVLALSDHEKALMRAVGVLNSLGKIDPTTWSRLLAMLAYNGGNTILTLPHDTRSHKLVPAGRSLFFKILSENLPPHAQFIEEMTQMVAKFRDEPGVIGRAVTGALYQGARWLEADDLASSRVFQAKPSHGSLLIGHLRDSGEPICYAGDASLITIAAPGTGKSQSQVIPNLLTYPGSVFVLDVKGELWDATAAHRREKFGPVYRFSPTARDGRSHCYNPFDAIGTDPVDAANACQVFANQLVPDSTEAKDPFWDRRARDFTWALAMLVALSAPREQRTLLSVTNYLSVGTNFEDNPESFKGSRLESLALTLEKLAVSSGMPDLANAAAAMRDGIMGTRLGSIFDSARSHLNALARTPTAIAATSRTDWSPLDLRAKPGMSVYLSFRPGEMQAFAGIIRLILQQHADALTRDFRPGTGGLPITFFLDEMPQLGALQSLNDLLEVGRGAGLRLWMFAQFLGQIKAAYGERTNGIVGATQVRCFMQPDTEAAEFIQPLLGKRRNVLTGQEQPLAETHELTSRVYGDHTIVVPRDEFPALLTKRMAYQDTPELMAKTPPEVPKVPVQTGPASTA